MRSSYGGRTHGALWTRWAKEAIEEWKRWDAKWDAHHPRLFFQTGDLILRDDWAPLMEDSRNEWDAQDATYEILNPAEIKERWPVIDVSEVRVGLYEPGAGVVRARRAIEAVADELRAEGGTVLEGTAVLGDLEGPTMDDLQLTSGDRLSADAYVLALGPWFPKALPSLMAQRLRVGTVGHVFYYGTPVGDERYRYPNLPSFNVPGVTGWPALGRDFRGFRVRTGAHRDDDPDASVRWIPEQDHRRPRAILEMYFPGLADAPLLETRACHYESSVDRNFFIDRHPGMDNVWLAGGGSAEGFKFGPKVGHYAAQRVLGIDDDPELRDVFALKEQVFEEGD